ncbi:MAG TPA: DedA family protein [Acetobacteraceae bacterium]
MAIESACIPLPSEIILPFSGYLVAIGRFDLFLVATAGAIGCNLGSTVAYAVGFYGGRPAVERWGRYILLNRHELARVESYFARWGSITVLVSRLLPVIRTFIALPAGIARMPMLRFQLYTFIGSWPWCFVLAYIGMRLGQAWDTSPALQAAFRDLHLVIFALLLLAAAVYAAWQWRRRPPA